VDSVTQLNCDVLVVGGGPAGIAAAVTAAAHGKQVVLVDDNARAGGQIWRGGPGASRLSEAEGWFERLKRSSVQTVFGARVFHARDEIVDAESDRSLLQIRFARLVLATGARELFLPFPGWTLPNVVGAGGLQALVKSGLPVKGKRVVLAGTGPLLLAVAAYLSKHGADIMGICEQASSSQLAKFAIKMLAFPAKIAEAMKLRLASLGAPYWRASWPEEALGKERLEAVRVASGGRTQELECDYLACGFHLVPNTELAQMMGCRLSRNFVEVGEFQETSQKNVYCAGEPTGIGGVELSLIEGRIAGHAAANAPDAARQLFGSRTRYRKIVKAMKVAFALRPELASLAKPATLLCRCEDVALERVRKYDSWKEAKLHTRCGMGPCQGRICGAAGAFLFGWSVESMRPPVFPARCASLAAMSSFAEGQQSIGGTP
jgi:NADPH-dependent 2,4-dienoyl-CoA reductase/sulfur reductase-like enzyme